MFVVVPSTSASSGVIDHRFPFVCEHCGEQADAVVQSIGHATTVGGGAYTARAEAVRDAYFIALQAVRETPCPQCGRVAAVVEKTQVALARSLEWKKKYPLRIALGTGASVLLLSAYPAIRDLRHSPALLITALGLALMLAAGLYAVLAWPPRQLPVLMARVYFWRTGLDRLTAWVPAAPRSAPLPTRYTSLWTGIAAGVAALVCLFGFAEWRGTYRDAYIVGGFDVRVDGTSRRDLAVKQYRDVEATILTVRKGESRRVELVAEDGTVHGPFELADDEARGWIVAPNAEAIDLCFGELEIVYGTSRRTPESRVFDNPTGLIVLKRGYDDLFENSPSSQKVQQGSSVTRWSLRAGSCKELRAN